MDERQEPDSRTNADVDPSLIAKVANFILFQVVYFACVLGAVGGNHWIGPLAGLALLPVNLALAPPSWRRSEPRLWIACGVIGLVADSALMRAGVVDFPEVTRIAPEAAITAWLVPPWIVTLWIAVGTMLHTSLAWLRGRYLLAAALGALGGPLSFWSGERLGATELPLGSVSLVGLGLEYALLVPILLWLAERYFSPAPPSAPSITVFEPEQVPLAPLDTQP